MLLYYLHHMLAIYILFVPDVQKINGVGSKLALGATSEWVIVHAINDHLFPGTVEYMYQRVFRLLQPVFWIFGSPPSIFPILEMSVKVYFV